MTSCPSLQLSTHGRSSAVSLTCPQARNNVASCSSVTCNGTDSNGIENCTSKRNLTTTKEDKPSHTASPAFLGHLAGGSNTHAPCQRQTRSSSTGIIPSLPPGTTATKPKTVRGTSARAAANPLSWKAWHGCWAWSYKRTQPWHSVATNSGCTFQVDEANMCQYVAMRHPFHPPSP